MLEKIENYLKNITKKDFIYLVIFSVLVDISTILWNIYYSNDLIRSMQELLVLNEAEKILNMTSGEAIWMMLLFILSLIVIILSIISLIGILKFKNWGRRFYIYAFIASLFMVIIPGVHISTMPELALSMIGSITSGIIFVLIFTEPIKKYFR